MNASRLSLPSKARYMRGYALPAEQTAIPFTAPSDPIRQRCQCLSERLRIHAIVSGVVERERHLEGVRSAHYAEDFQRAPVISLSLAQG